MKKLITLFAAATLLSGTALGQSTIVGSGHDFSDGSVFDAQGQICLPCHTPHNAYSLGGDEVLWNHAATTQTFTMYTTLGGTTGVADGTSLLCLSCHDGVTAMDNYGGSTPVPTVMTGTAVSGIDLSDDHPIGIAYPATGAYEATPKNGLPLFDVGGVDRVECASCHDPHGAGYTFFLRNTTANSALCLDCHAL